MTQSPLPNPDTLLRDAARDRGPGAALAGLGELGGARVVLDDLEHRLIDAARDHGATWTQVATALGLASRQAAEQRWLRLGGMSTRDVPTVRDAQRRQRVIDKHFGEPVSELRTAATELYRRIRTDRRWGDRFTRARLARDTLEAALDAPPGSLYTLAVQVLDDVGDVRLPSTTEAALDDLRAALGRATPA